MVADILSFSASRSQLCYHTRNARVYCPEYPRILSGEPPRGVFTCPVHAMGVIRDLLERVYCIYESVASFCCCAVVALNSAQLSFFSGIAGRDDFAAFVAARLSFASCSASRFSARLSALST